MGLLHRLSAHLRDASHRITRPAAVNEAQRAHVKANPTCASCGSTTHCQGHHIAPYHAFPELAASPENFITLCMSENECHIRIGHGDLFRTYNPNVVKDAADALGGIPRGLVETRARLARQPDEP